MIRRYQKTAISQYAIVGLILIGLVAFGFLSTIFMRDVPFVDYFALPWAAGRAWLLEGQNPYDLEVTQIAGDAISESGYSGQLPQVGILIHPLMNLFFFLPFSLIPYPISRAIWVVTLGIFTLLTVHFSLKFSERELSGFGKIGNIAFLLFWFPGIYTLLIGHISPIIIFLMVYGLWSIKMGQYQRAGFILALTAGALPLTLFILMLALLWSIARRQWSYVIAFFSGFAFLVIVSLLMLPSWPLDWLRTVVGTYQDLNWVQTPLMSLASVLPGIENFLSIGLHVLFGVLLLILWIRLFGKSERVFMWNALAIFVITVLFQVQNSISGLLLLIPPLCLIFRYIVERWKLTGKIMVWVSLILISVGSWLLILPEIQFLEAVSVPFMTIGLPLLVFIGMIWIRWWVVRFTSLPRI